jgi:hypothetical protein
MIASSRDRDDAVGESGAPSAARSDRGEPVEFTPIGDPRMDDGNVTDNWHIRDQFNSNGGSDGQFGPSHVARNSDGKPGPRC